MVMLMVMKGIIVKRKEELKKQTGRVMSGRKVNG